MIGKILLFLLGVFILLLGYSAIQQPGFADSQVLIGDKSYTPRLGIYLLIAKGLLVITVAVYWWYRDLNNERS